MSDYLSSDARRAIARLIEERRELLRALERADPVRQMREHMDDWATQFQLAQTALLDSGHLLQFEGAVSSLRRDFLSLSSHLEEEFRDRALQITAFEALRHPAIESRLASVLSHQRELADLGTAINQSYESVVTPVRQIQSALASLEASARLYSAPEAHWSNALAVVASYEQFAIRQTKKLGSDSKVVGPRRARVTELAGALLVSSLGPTEAAGSEPQSEAPTVAVVKPRIFGPLNSHLGFVYRASVEVDVDLAVAGALPTRICHLGGAIISIAVRINEAFRRAGGEDVFRPTNRSLWAASVIPAVVSGNETDFADVVDALFFLLYEGSAAGSKENSRLSPLLTEDGLQLLLWVKHLRVYYRHDIDHGDDKDVAKKHHRVGNIFMVIAGKRTLTRSAEWTAAQAELYKHLFEMLTKAEEAAEALPPVV